MVSFPGGSCSRGNPKGVTVMQGSHGKMRKDGFNCLREALQASLLVHQGDISMAIEILGFSKVSNLVYHPGFFYPAACAVPLPSDLHAGGSIHMYLYSYHIQYTEILGSEQKSKDLLDAHYVSSIEHCRTVKKRTRYLSISIMKAPPPISNDTPIRTRHIRGGSQISQKLKPRHDYIPVQEPPPHQSPS